METDSRIPAEAFHLADLIKEEMAERKWSITDLVMNMGPPTLKSATTTSRFDMYLLGTAPAMNRGSFLGYTKPAQIVIAALNGPARWEYSAPIENVG